eukprot:gene54848-16804_t
MERMRTDADKDEDKRRCNVGEHGKISKGRCTNHTPVHDSWISGAGLKKRDDKDFIPSYDQLLPGHPARQWILNLKGNKECASRDFSPLSALAKC